MRVLRVLIFALAAFLSVNAILDPFSVVVSGAEVLQIERPVDVVDAIKYNGTSSDGKIPHTPALFGMPNYLLEKRGTLVYVPQAEGEVSSRQGCTAIDPTKSPYWRSLFPDPAGELPSRPVVLLVDRGGCTFTKKIRNAQEALNGNVISVLVANNEPTSDPNVLPYMQDDGHGKDLQLSSLMIGKIDADLLKTFLIDRERDQEKPPIIVHVQYSVPNPDGRVEYELWTSSIDEHSASFKAAFGEIARQLREKAVLTPHYFTVDGTEWGCASTTSTPCGNQCVTGGKYCASDPEKNTDVGYSGEDIVYENIRQLCLWKYIQPDTDVDTDKRVVIDDDQQPFNQPLVWFDYVERLAKYCSDSLSWKDESCSFKVLESLDSTVPQLSTKVKSCFVEAQKSISAKQPVTLLDNEMDKQVKSGIFVLPQAFVNKRPYYGSLNCPSPLSSATCSLLSMICAGYSVQPELCQVLPENNTPTSSGSSIGVVIAIVIAFGVVAGIAVYLYMKKQNMAMRDDIDSLLKQYLPLEGGGVAGLEPGSKHNSTNGNGTHSISLGSLTSSGITPGKKRAAGQDGHRLIGQGTLDEEDEQL